MENKVVVTSEEREWGRGKTEEVREKEVQTLRYKL